MTKNEAIQTINHQLVGAERLNSENTHWANVIRYGSKEGWWLNVPFHKFDNELHLILNSANQFTHITIPSGAIAAPRTKFRNKGESADIFIPCAGRDRLIDVQAGGSTGHDFSNYKLVEYKYK